MTTKRITVATNSNAKITSHTLLSLFYIFKKLLTSVFIGVKQKSILKKQRYYTPLKTLKKCIYY
jgi:hypothetical protein